MSASPYEFVVDENGAIVLVIRQWLPSAATVVHLGKKEAAFDEKGEVLEPDVMYVTQEQLWNVCQSELKFEQHQRVIPGTDKRVDESRLTMGMGDDTVKEHTYSRGAVVVRIQPWHPMVKSIRDRVYKETHIYCNSCLPLKYRHKMDSIGFHPDREVTPPHNVVVTISAGQSRKFIMKRNSDGKRVTVTLNMGDACIMWGRTQELWTHAIEPEPYLQPHPLYENVRYSLTMRQLSGTHLRPSKDA
ncbi:2OG-Fe(II) oxygenase superfamily protein [uncultured virus]|nr:2OG-Fe(II) oxygenase superfamily protein [uncultured virus]